MQGVRRGSGREGLGLAGCLTAAGTAKDARLSRRKGKSQTDKQKRPFGSRPSSWGGATGLERVVARRCVHPAGMATGRVHSATASPCRQPVPGRGGGWTASPDRRALEYGTRSERGNAA